MRLIKKVFILLVVLIIAYSVYFFLFPWEEREFYMHSKVEDVIGFYTNDTALMFGTIPPGAYGTKTITISNGEETLKFVHITASGNLSKWTKVSENNFMIFGKTNRTFKVIVAVPKDAEFGEYEGMLKISFKKLLL